VPSGCPLHRPRHHVWSRPSQTSPLCNALNLLAWRIVGSHSLVGKPMERKRDEERWPLFRRFPLATTAARPPGYHSCHGHHGTAAPRYHNSPPMLGRPLTEHHQGPRAAPLRTTVFRSVSPSVQTTPARAPLGSKGSPERVRAAQTGEVHARALPTSLWNLHRSRSHSRSHSRSGALGPCCTLKPMLWRRGHPGQSRRTP
jgi:hypothetical protein